MKCNRVQPSLCFGVEKLLRDATAFLHSDGVNRTLFLKAANIMFE